MYIYEYIIYEYMCVTWLQIKLKVAENVEINLTFSPEMML